MFYRKAPKEVKGQMMNNLKKGINLGEVHHGGRTVTLTNNQRSVNRVKLTKKTIGGAGSGGSSGGGLRSLMTSDMKVSAARDLQEIKVRKG